MDWIFYYFEILKTAATNKPIEFGTLALAGLVAFFGALKAIALGIVWFFPKSGTPTYAVCENDNSGVAIGSMNESQVIYQPTPIGHVTLSIEDYQANLKQREMEIRAELEQAHAEEKAVLQAQLAELTNQQENPKEAFAAFKARIAELEVLLGNAETDDEIAAKEALDAGNLIRADELFERIQIANQMYVKKAAKAAFARGEIAKEQIRWKDAAFHFAEAARLDPNYDVLFEARLLAWQTGNYPAAISFGEDLVITARKEFGEGHQKYAEALNEHALSLHAKGRYDEAEPLYRQALEITEAALGKAHPDYATSLNNLAELLRATGRMQEAEPLFREALEITGAALGKAHPDYAQSLNNLAALLEATGRYDEAEPLYREAVAVIEAALGADHPTSQIVRGNLELFLADKAARSE